MLDYFIRGSVNRISPEAPVPVVEVEEESEHPGGAGNVCYNVATLLATPFIFGVVGSDNNAKILNKTLANLNINTNGLVINKNRPTTVKARIIAGSQHIVRVDRESRSTISQKLTDKIADKFGAIVQDLDAVILQDYNKGVLCKPLISYIIQLSNRHKIPIFVDPKRENFFEYKDCTVFKPNRKEAEDALGFKLNNLEKIEEGSNFLLDKLNCKYVVLTLSKEGMVIAEKGKKIVHIPTNAIQVADVSGAGDTVISALAVSYASGCDIRESAKIANIAAGIVCEKLGTEPIYFKELVDAVKLV